MPVSYPAHRYQEVEIKTASALELVVLLYDAAIAGLQKAQEHIANRDIASRTRCLNKACSIITELQVSLDFEEGGTVASSLDRLYNYMKSRIFDANLHQDAGPLREVAGLLANLRSAWAQVAQDHARKNTETAMTASAPALTVTAGGPGASPLAGLHITA
jgi:flagellar secretion chaperone FliS